MGLESVPNLCKSKLLYIEKCIALDSFVAIQVEIISCKKLSVLYVAFERHRERRLAKELAPHIQKGEKFLVLNQGCDTCHGVAWVISTTYCLNRKRWGRRAHPPI